MQDYQTPSWVAHKMCDLVLSSPKLIVEPTPGAGQLVAVIEERFPKATVFTPVDYWQDVRGVFPYSVIIANPPFSPSSEGFRYLNDFMLRSDRIVTVMPWVALYNSHKRMLNLLNFGLKGVYALPRNAFNRHSVASCVLDLEKGYRGFCKFDYWVK